jgi:pimeloyl-ACP methyl ester carboxylesterase
MIEGLKCGEIIGGIVMSANNSGKVSVDTVQTDDFSMDYCRFGDGDNILVILPGLSIQNVMDSADAIAEAYHQLTDDYTIYVFERRRDLPQSYTVFDTARDTAQAIRTIGLKNISIMGASYGGMAAMTIAVQHPELVHKMVLASTSAAVDEEEYQTIDKWIRLAESGEAARLYLSFGEMIYPADVYEQFRDLLVDAAETVTEEDLVRFIILARGMKGFDITDQLDQIQCPVMAVGDRQDRVLGAKATETIARYLDHRPDFRLHMYDGYGHALYDVAPDFKELMLSFLKSDTTD